MFELDSEFNLHLAIRDLECGLATQILGEYLEPERYGTCDFGGVFGTVQYVVRVTGR